MNRSKVRQVNELFRLSCVCGKKITGHNNSALVSQPEQFWQCNVRDTLCGMWATEGLIELCSQNGIILYNENGENLVEKIQQKREGVLETSPRVLQPTP